MDWGRNKGLSYCKVAAQVNSFQGLARQCFIVIRCWLLCSIWKLLKGVQLKSGAGCFQGLIEDPIRWPNKIATAISWLSQRRQLRNSFNRFYSNHQTVAGWTVPVHQTVCSRKIDPTISPYEELNKIRLQSSLCLQKRMPKAVLKTRVASQEPPKAKKKVSGVLWRFAGWSMHNVYF